MMDNGQGRFDPVPATMFQQRVDERATGLDGIFAVGDVVEIRGSRFKVQALGSHEMRLRLLPREVDVPEMTVAELVAFVEARANAERAWHDHYRAVARGPVPAGHERCAVTCAHNAAVFDAIAAKLRRLPE